MENNREFIQGMLKAFSTIYRDANPTFSNDTYKLATDPNVSFVELKKRFEQICKDNGIPMSEGLKKFQTALDEAVKVEEQTLQEEDTEKVEVLNEETVENSDEITTEAVEEVQESGDEVLEEIVEDKLEEDIVEEPLEVEQVEEIESTVDSLGSDVTYSNDKVVLDVGINDNVDSIGKQLLDLKAQGIVAEALINGVLLSNANFDNMDQLKSNYYAVEAQKLKDFYNNAMLNKNDGEHINMAIITPEGESDKRTVMINNQNNPSVSTVVEFSDGKDFDHYVMPELLDTIIDKGDTISVIDDQFGITRGNSFAPDEPKQDRYLYMAEMSNGNQLAISMAESSIDAATKYINQRLEDVTDKVNEEANQIIDSAIENEHELEKADAKVKQLKFDKPSSGFVTGLGIGIVIGISIIVIIIVLYLLKVF